MPISYLKKMKNLILALIAGSLMFTSCKRNIDEDLPPIDTAKREVISNYSPTIFVGNETAASVDGTGREARFYQINKVTADKAGNVYVLEAARAGNSFFKIRKVTTAGVTTTIFSGGRDSLGFRGKIYKILDIAVGFDGSVYTLAFMVNSAITTIDGGVSKTYQEYGTYKLSADTLAKVSVSTTMANLGAQPSSWVAAHNLLTNIAVDAGGTVYGAYTPASPAGTAAGTKIYQVTPNPVRIDGNTDGIFGATLTAGAAGTAYASTATNILKITATGVSSIFTFPTVRTNFKPKLAGAFNGNLVVYGDVYDKANVFKGTGFYTIKTDGTIVTKSILNVPVNVVGAVMVAGKIYYAIQLNSGAYMIHKITLD
jgi:hypothetical protein